VSEAPLLPPDVFRPNEPTFIIAGGPSISDMLLAPLRGRQLVTVNMSYKLFPDSTVHFSCDNTWIQKNAADFEATWKGRYKAFCHFQWKGDRRNGPLGMVVYDHDRIAIGPKGRAYHDKGFCTKLNALRGNNSGGMAINLAWHLGARLAILLGFDMKMKGDQMHWYKEAPRSIVGNRTTFTNIFIPVLNSVRTEAEAAGLRIVNCTPDSALTCFERGALEDYL
jgi:hypothetical protein